MTNRDPNAHCRELVHAGAWSDRARCKRKAGFGENAAYCKQHSANHMGQVNTVVTWYKAANSDRRVDIQPVEVIEEGKSHLIVKTSRGSRRESKISSYEIYLPTREAAIEHYRSKVQALRNKADLLEREVNAYEKQS